MATAQKSERLAALSAVGTSIWLDMIRRSLLTDGELDRLASEDSVVGVTSNPSIFEKAILGSPDYDEQLSELAHDGDAQSIYEALALKDVGDAADILRPLWDRTAGGDGYVSMEVAPDLARDTEGTTAAVADYWRRLDRPNVMIKIPGTPEGVPAIKASIAAGINVNVTLLFSVDAYANVSEAYIAGLEERVAAGEPIDGLASVASFFVSRVDTLVDGLLSDAGHDELAGTAGIANAQVAYARYQEIVASDRWRALEDAGASRQRPLWASTSVKDPAYRDVMYVEELAGPETVNTMPMETLLAFADHGEVRDRLSGSEESARERMAELASAGIDIDAVTEQLLKEGIEKFEDAMSALESGIERRREGIVAGRPHGISTRLTDEDARAIGERVQWAEDEDVPRRVWRRDYTLWGTKPDEISNRLGWLRVAEEVLEHYGELEGFTERARADGMTDFVVLGMGGSSLAPEVMRRSFPDADGLRLQVLDSTHPDTVMRIADSIPIQTTVFCVSSKSGTTLEPNCFHQFFAERCKDPSHFVAVTDPDTALDELGREQGFGHVFNANPDIGGRYSALTHFGMVPATAAGIDTREILERGEGAAQSTVPTLRCDESAPLWLGLALGDLARRGRDKLTFVADPPLESFGLWAEQLVAESTGKHGTGIVPIAGEPLGDPEAYGEDRVFARVRNTADTNPDADQRLAALADAGHPVIELPFTDPEDVGGQFLGWEFAIAIAGAVLGINSFDQPNVQQAKDLTKEVIDAYVKDGSFPEDEPGPSESPLTVHGSDAASVVDALRGLLADAGPGRFFAALAYVPESGPADAALEDLRVAVRDARRCATTTGYGPRYLHSTGQLHKGGTPSGIFLQVTSDGREGVEVPGAGYDFAALIKAQAIGDMRALRSKDLPALTVHVAGDPADGMLALAEAIKAAVRA